MGESVRATVYLDAALHRALRLKAASTHRPVSELVNEAVRAALREDGKSLGALLERPASYDAVLAEVKAELRPSVRCKFSAEELLARWRHLPEVDPVRFREDIDSIIDSSL